MQVTHTIQPKFGALILKFPAGFKENGIPQIPDRFLTSARTLAELIESAPDQFQHAQINIHGGSYVGPENPNAILPDGSIWLLSRNRRLWPVKYSPLNGKIQEDPRLAEMTDRLRAGHQVSASEITEWLKVFIASKTGPMVGEGSTQRLTSGLRKVGTEEDRGKFQCLVVPPAVTKAIP